MHRSATARAETFAQVMTVVKSLVKSGMTICATIHSPTPYCFNLFDTLMILLRGNVVYFGENGAPCFASASLRNAVRLCLCTVLPRIPSVESHAAGYALRYLCIVCEVLCATQ